MVRFLFVLILSFFISPLVIADGPDFDKVSIKTMPLKNGIYMLQGKGGNIAVSTGRDGTFMIDDEYAPLTEKVTKAVKQLSQKPIRFVINTHWHGDHTGGNENLGKRGAIIVAHENVRETMTKEHFIEIFNWKVPPSPKEALPIITFKEQINFHLNNDDIHVVHVSNAHTSGDSIVIFKKANIIHTGDIFFNGIYPFIDTPNGGSLPGMIAGVEAILTHANRKTKIIPGHGPLANKKDLKQYLKMLKGIHKNVARLKSDGKSLEETIAAKPTEKYDAVWGKGFLTPKQFTQLAYASAKKN